MIKRNNKIILTLLIILGIALTPLKRVEAHSVELDPESLISMPMMILGGNGTITIKNTVKDYTLYFQAVKIDNSTYSQINQIEAEGKAKLTKLKEEYTALKTELDTLKEIYNTVSSAYTEGLNNSSLTELEKEELKTNYETAKTNYQNKVTEYNNKVDEYNNKVKETNNKIKELTPMYVENNWTKATDNKIAIDTTKFSGEQPYTIWVKLVTSNGTYYDEGIYTMSGTKVEETKVTGVNLNKTTLSLTKESNYTLIATITPSDAANKKLIWKSDNENVATVENGKVTTKSIGTATITVTTEDGNFSATCKVTVTEKTNSTVDDSKKDTTKNQVDTTVAQGKLPFAGTNTVLLSSIVVIILIAILFYNKYFKYRDIK